MLIDSHCHFDSSKFDIDRLEQAQLAQQAGVKAMIIPAVLPKNFKKVQQVAESMSGGYFALGIHPMFVRFCDRTAIAQLEKSLEQVKDHPKFVGLGEIGLDFFVKEISEGQARQEQEWFYQKQLDLAIKYELPVILHVRRSQDILLKYLRQRPLIGGIAHAFNGSYQQAEQFIEQGFLLGIGGTVTYTRSKQIQRLATRYEIEHYALETDAPDIPPAWLTEPEPRNTPSQVARIAKCLAQLRGVDTQDVIKATGNNVQNIFKLKSHSQLI